jgi:hypothetical protein
VPSHNDRVLIQPGQLVLYSSTSTARIAAVEVGGRLVFSTNVDTKLVVGTLTVMPTGTLQIGSQAVPVSPDVTAEIVIADRPLNLTADPRQYGTGLLAFGKVSIFGSQLAQTWTRLAAQPRAGATYLVLEQADDRWQPGDTLVLPDTRQVGSIESDVFTSGNLPPQWEEITVRRVVGNRVYLSKPLDFDHLGARDATGKLVLLPHAAILDRNVVIRSENPNGTRGHVMLLARADVDIEYARFQDLGRTDALRPLDNTVIDAEGNLVHLGANQVGRYAVHMHHLIGPENPTNTGYQFKFIGNTIDGARKWSVAVHGSSYGLIDRNVAYDAQGAAFVTEDGSEAFNVFSDNIAIRMVGTRSDGDGGPANNDYGRGGSGFWFRRGGNTIVGNVAADSSQAGFVFNGYFNLQALRLPLFRGAMPGEVDQGYASDLSPPTLMQDNEAYGLSIDGLWAAYITGNNLADNQSQTLIEDLRLWNIHRAAVHMYHTSDVTFSRLAIYGDWNAQERNDTGAVGMRLSTYENRNLVIRDSVIQNYWMGIIAPRADASRPGREKPTIIENSRLHNYINIVVQPSWDDGGTDGSSLVVRNVKFTMRTDVPSGPKDPSQVLKPANIRMEMQPALADYTELVAVRVYGYNQVPGDDFRVYFKEQAAGVVVPKTDPAALIGDSPGPIGSPYQGLTNAQNWSLAGIAIGGGVAPTTGLLFKPEIFGLVSRISNVPITPRPVFVTPWSNAIIPYGNTIRIRYNMQGNLPDGYSVWFTIDNRQPFNDFTKGGPYELSPGTHLLRAWVGNANGVQLAGSLTSAVFFRVAPAPVGALAAPSEVQATEALASALSIGTTAKNFVEESSNAVTATTPVLPASQQIAYLASMSPTTAKAVQFIWRRAGESGQTEEVAADEELVTRLATAIVAARRD